ncbi:uncharacterized protein LOC119676203 [Teleopsis dalmanni]|uniref:uncharacterized protein LOC119676203 n=1 Tax=Teleopsis dalmanni TaxID=139649 RepID=UPI0018CF942F|nr:uncharacterized protein LOC119676203 [Teleopsis dalmanni]
METQEEVQLSDEPDAYFEHQIFYQPIQQNSIDNSKYDDYNSKKAAKIENNIKTKEVISSSEKQYPHHIGLKPTKLSCKTVGLKRVSFGSSKGSMVETLVFETPTPLSEHSEMQFGFGDSFKCKTSFSCGVNPEIKMTNSGIDTPEEYHPHR